MGPAWRVVTAAATSVRIVGGGGQGPSSTAVGASARWRLAAAGFEVEIEAARGAETIAASVRRWAAAMAS
jgi:hypothetical protein